MKSEITWDPENFATICKVHLNDGSIVEGRSYCHPTDRDLGGELVGSTIAASRAEIAAVKKEIAEHKSRLKGINHCLSILNQSSVTDKNGYEYKTVARQAKIENGYINDLELVKNLLEEDLTYYIASKDRAYVKYRNNRSKQK